MNSAVVVSSRSWVRCAGRQSQRLQVTPASSHHTTSPVSGCSTTAMSSATASKDRSPLKPDQARRPYLAVQVLSAERQQVVADRAAGRAGVTLVERPNPQAAINDVVVEVHASGFVPDEMEWPSTPTDRAGHDRTPSILGHDLAGVVTARGYGTTGVSVGQRVFGIRACFERV